MTAWIPSRIARIALVPIVALLTLTGCERTELNGIGSYTPDDLAPPQLDVAMSGCSIGEWGWVTGTGTVQNRTDDVATYEVVVVFESGETRLGQGSTWIRDLSAGQTATFDASTHLGERSGEMSSCEVATINRWSAETRAVGTGP